MEHKAIKFFDEPEIYSVASTVIAISLRELTERVTNRILIELQYCSPRELAVASDASRQRGEPNAAWCRLRELRPTAQCPDNVRQVNHHETAARQKKAQQPA